MKVKLNDKKPKKRKSNPLSTEIKKLDVVFGKYIKLKHCKGKGYCNCVTCGKVLKLGTQDLQAGHFVRRGNYGLRWNEYNVNPQCVRCNKWLNGNEGNHAEYIINEYGIEVFNQLMQIKRQLNPKPKIKEVKELIEIYEKKLKEF